MEITHKKLKVTIAFPDDVTGKQYQAYFTAHDAADSQPDSRMIRYKLLPMFFGALAIAEKAVWSHNGAEKDLKELAEDTPVRIMRWVGEQGVEVIDEALKVPEA